MKRLLSIVTLFAVALATAAEPRAFLEKPFAIADLQQALLRSVGRPRREEAVSEQTAAGDDLASVCVADVLWSAMAERFAGALHFKHRQRHKVLLMPDGDVDYFSEDWLDLVSMS